MKAHGGTRRSTVVFLARIKEEGKEKSCVGIWSEIGRRGKEWCMHASPGWPFYRPLEAHSGHGWVWK